MFPVKVTSHASDHTVCFLTERYRQQFSRNVGTDSTATHPTRQISTDKVGTHFSLLIFCETSFSSRDSSVSIVTELRTKRPNQGSKPSTGKRFLSRLHSVGIDSAANPALTSWMTGSVSPEVMTLGHTIRLHRLVPWLRMDGARPSHVFRMWCLIKHTDKFAAPWSVGTSRTAMLCVVNSETRTLKRV
jgi:hypothetical protein